MVVRGKKLRGLKWEEHLLDLSNMARVEGLRLVLPQACRSFFIQRRLKCLPPMLLPYCVGATTTAADCNEISKTRAGTGSEFSGFCF